MQLHADHAAPCGPCSSMLTMQPKHSMTRPQVVTPICLCRCSASWKLFLAGNVLSRLFHQQRFCASLLYEQGMRPR
eukprot:364407-Chlamydomonas_euryale.AAC.3